MAGMRLFVLRLDRDRNLVIDIEAQGTAAWDALLSAAVPIVEIVRVPTLRRTASAPRAELSLRRPSAAVDAALLALEVLELGRRPDVVRGELHEVVGRQVTATRVADEDVDPRRV